MWLRICAEDPGIWPRLWAIGLYVRESIANAGMRDSFGIVQFSGKPGEKPGEQRKHCEASVRGGKSVCFPFSQLGVLTREGDTRMGWCRASWMDMSL